MAIAELLKRAGNRLTTGLKRTSFMVATSAMILGAVPHAKAQTNQYITVLDNPVKIAQYDDRRVEFSAVPVSTGFQDESYIINLEVRDVNKNTKYTVTAREDVDQSNIGLLKDIDYMLNSDEKDQEGIITYNRENPHWSSIEVMVSGIYDHRGVVYEKGVKEPYEHGNLELESITLLNDRFMTDPEGSRIYTVSEDQANLIFVPSQNYGFVYYPVGVTPYWDLDRDGIPDLWRGYYSGYRWDTRFDDYDSDGLPNWLEWRLGTDPFSRDTDRDGLSDYWEYKLHTNPLYWDTDHDGWADGFDPYPYWGPQPGFNIQFGFGNWGMFWTNYYSSWDMWQWNHWHHPHRYGNYHHRDPHMINVIKEHIKLPSTYRKITQEERESYNRRLNADRLTVFDRYGKNLSQLEKKIWKRSGFDINQGDINRNEKRTSRAVVRGGNTGNTSADKARVIQRESKDYQGNTGRDVQRGNISSQQDDNYRTRNNQRNPFYDDNTRNNSSVIKKDYKLPDATKRPQTIDDRVRSQNQPKNNQNLNNRLRDSQNNQQPNRTQTPQYNRQRTETNQQPRTIQRNYTPPKTNTQPKVQQKKPQPVVRQRSQPKVQQRPNKTVTRQSNRSSANKSAPKKSAPSKSSSKKDERKR